MEEKSVRELVEQFEKDVKFDSHHVRTRVRRSNAGKELVRRGTAVLAELADHLQETQPAEGRWELRMAWGWLLISIEGKHDLPNGPGMPDNLDGWIKWAQANATD